MGIMPADRELKWQRVFRRFGLPVDTPGKDSSAADKTDEAQRTDEAAKRQTRENRRSNKK